MECDATVKAELGKGAWPVPSRAPAPGVAVPPLTVPVPAGTPPPGALAVTVAVNVTAWLNTEGLAEELVTVVVAAAFTTCGAPLSVPLLFAQPLAPVKAAVRVWLATASAVVPKAAWPAPSTVTPAAQTVAPSVNVTVPAGTPAPEVTVAVKVTACPNVEGLGAELSEIGRASCRERG